jgi:Outer membrane lipoprotein-sorting protein
LHSFTGVLLALGAVAAEPALIHALAATPEDKTLLRRSDFAAHAPTSFRARMRLSTQDKAVARVMNIEVWHSDESRTLVRFLDSREQGKYLIYEGARAWFLSPGAAKPVRLPHAFRLQGSASLDDLLGFHYSRDFTIAGVVKGEGPATGQVTFDLRDNHSKAPYPRVRYVVDAVSGRPILAEFHLPSGRLASSVEFVAWSADGILRPRVMLLKDMLRGGTVTRIEILEMVGRPIPAGLFDRQDGTERARLEKAP